MFLTSVPSGPVEDASGIREFFAETAKRVEAEGIHVLQEKIYGVRERMEEILGGREGDVPATFIEGTPCIGGCLAGLQITGIVPRAKDVACRTLYAEGTPVGRSVAANGTSMLFLSGVSGLDGRRSSGAPEQAGRMFRAAREMVEAEGYSVTDIARTWIYLPRILEWYGEFNRVRAECFQEFGLIEGKRVRYLPASTGIQGRRAPDEECFMDVLVVGSADATRPMKNPRQNEAFEYGSFFSRGSVVPLPGPATLYLSGTASIDTAGRTVCVGDARAQVRYTLKNVASLLGTEGAGLGTICQATAFCKDAESWKAFAEERAAQGLEGLPVVSVFADVCRDDLLFEMEAVAVAGTGEGRS
ncbi:MAG: RidA family protein [Planctomycetota bacterium]